MLKNLTGVAAVGALMAGAACGFGQVVDSSFTYQGELAWGGVPASGMFDLRFRLFDAASGGTQIGSDLCLDDLAVSNGRMDALLDFGAVFGGQQRYLEIEVREDAGLGCADGSGMSTLSPRQALSAVPHASFAVSAKSAGDAATLGGQTPGYYLNAENLTGLVPPESLGGNYYGAISLSNPANRISGDGTDLYSLNATAISSGVLSAARLPSNWAAGGDLTGFFPSPAIAAGAVDQSKLSAEVQTSLSLWGTETVEMPAGSMSWGNNVYGPLEDSPLPLGTEYVMVAASTTYSLGLRSDGVVVGRGSNSFGQLNVPALPEGVTYTQISAAELFALALRSDGTVVGWGSGPYGELNVPAAPAGKRCVAISTAYNHAMALWSDGTVSVWGSASEGVRVVPVLPAGMKYVAIGAGRNFCVALRDDGAVIAWGRNTRGQTNVPALPEGVRYTSIAVGAAHALAIRSDGQIAAWGETTHDELEVPVLPQGVRYTSVVAGAYTSFAFRSDGVLVSWGMAFWGNDNIPLLPPGIRITSVAVGTMHAVALVSEQVSQATTGTIAGVAASMFSGSGLGLTDLNASNITRGLLANARTTGTSSMVTNTLVLRDAQGDFRAGTITANLVGNATTATSATTSQQADDATRLNGQLASFYADASNLTAGTLSPARLPTGGNWPLSSRLSVNSDALVVATNGNVGVGVASPLSPLHVSDAVSTVATISGTSTIGTWLNLFNSTGGIYWKLISSGSGNGEGAGKLLLGHSTDMGGNTPVMTLTTAGNVGIGTSNPGSRLTVAGSGAFTGSLSKGGGSFKIDHPLDPENKYLYHSFVESPDMMNVYNGTVVTDGAGFATITMPDYFEALNRDFRYQLTVIDSGENDLLLARVYRKMEANAFIIKTNVPHVEVSWQVTGIRHDAWAEQNRIPNAIEKPAGEKGKLLHPEAFGQPASKGIYFTPAAAAN